MKRPKQTPYDRILWALVSLDGKAEWTELRIRTKLKAAELDVVLDELVKDGRVSIKPDSDNAQKFKSIKLENIKHH